MQRNLPLIIIVMLSFVTGLSAQTWNLSGNSDATSSSKLGTLNSQPVRIFVKNSEKMRVDSQGRVAIGTTNPINIFTVQGSGGTALPVWKAGNPLFYGFGEGSPGNADFIVSLASSHPGGRPGLAGRRSRGTLAAPTAVINNDYLVSLVSSGYDGTNFQQPSGMEFFVDSAVTPGNVPSRISFVTGSNEANRKERLKVGYQGNFDFNNAQLFLQASTGNLAMGTNSPNASAIFDINSTRKGLLIPRMTRAQRDSITSPATGLLVYQTDTLSGFYYYSGSWKPMAASIGNFANQQLSNLSPNVAVNQNFTPDSSSTRSLGSSSAWWNSLYLNNGIYLQGQKFINAGTDVYAGSIGIGLSALSKLDSTASYYNTAIGYYSMTLNTSGYNNTGHGYYTLYANTSGKDNTAVGAQSLAANTSGNNNTATGSESLYSNQTGSDNTANGYSSLRTVVQGSRNTAIGGSALYSNNVGNNNTAVGYRAMYLQTGENNTALGYQAGEITTGMSNSTFVGSQTGSAANNLVNATAIGYGAIASASNTARVGNTAVTSIGGAVGWTNFSDGRFKTNIKENVPGIDFIKKLRPVTYNFDINALDKALNKGEKKEQSAIDIKAKEERSKVSYTGFIAQEVEKAAKEINYNFSGIDAPKNEKDIYGLRYAEFVVPLVKAVQELDKKTEEIDQLRKEVAELKQMVTALTAGKSAVDNTTTSVKLSDVTLEQNIPNPFGKTTSIGYNVPAGSKSASMVITNADGVVIKQVALAKPGKSLINVDASTLGSGSYTYTIYIDGRAVESKKMIVIR